MIRMIAFDMDGTALDDHKRVMPLTREILERAARRGIEVVPSTGRPYQGLTGEITSLTGVRYVLTTNGAGIYEKESGRCVHEDSMPLERLLELLVRLEPLEVMADAFVKGEAYMTESKRRLIDEMAVSPEIKEYIHTSRICVEDQAAYLRQKGDDVEKLTINFVPDEKGEKRDYDGVVEVLRDFPEFHAVSGGMHNIEVTGKGISKATGLAWLAEYLGIDREEIIAFGDSGNDVEMLRMAGVGVAMANGEPAAKEAADFITRSNNDEGIVYALRQYAPELFA